MNYDRPIVTLGDVRQWLRRRREIRAIIVATQEEDAELVRKLDAAKTLLGGLPDEDENEQASEMQAASEEDELFPSEDSVPQAILKAVGVLGGTPRPGDIRRWIKEHAPQASTKLAKTQTYLYTAIKRHVDYGRLIREGAGYRLPTSSPQGETRGDGPGSH